MASIVHRIKDLLVGLPAVSPLVIPLMLRNPKRLPVFLADTYRTYRAHARLRVPSIEPWELLGFKGEITMKLGENGLFAAMEPSFLMMQLVAMLKPERVFEIGTSQGRSTALIAMNTPPATKIFTLDLPPESQVPSGASDLHLIELARKELGIAFRDTNWSSRITQLLGDSEGFDFKPYYDSIDLATVDGSHTYKFVRCDSMNAFRMIRPGGVILWHDFESMRSEYGVSRFVDEMRDRHGFKVYRLGREQGDSRYAVMRVDAESKKRLAAFAANPSTF
ncbi:MAG: class I SAM-dependent methyltransferase [Planctomycetes bacterium]|nr:class I SAM-dependent methyltransferase [Planctomycetota bacterium]